MNTNGNFLDRFVRLLARHRLIVMIVVLVAFVVFTFGALKLRGAVVLQDMLPYDHPYLKLHVKFSEVFGSGGSGSVIIVRAKSGDIFNERTLTKIQKITNEIELWDEVYRILTVSMGSRSIKKVNALKRGEIRIEPLMWPDVPKTPEAIEALKASIFSNPAYDGTLVSKDGTAALIFTEFKENISYERAFGLLDKIAKTHGDGETEIHLIGYPVLMGWIYAFKQQIYLIFGVSFALMILMLFLIFRNGVGMVVPVVSCFFFTIVGLGIMGFTGFNFSPLLYVLAFLVGAMMISHAVQCTNRYLEELHACDNDRVEACYLTMKAMVVPAFAAITTDAAGFLVLGLAKIALMKQLSLVMSLWMISIICTSVLSPIICSFMPAGSAMERWSKDHGHKGALERGVLALTRFSIGRGRYVVGGDCHRSRSCLCLAHGGSQDWRPDSGIIAIVA
jgi:predicted RND superfamily exporter protein